MAEAPCYTEALANSRAAIETSPVVNHPTHTQDEHGVAAALLSVGCSTQTNQYEFYNPIESSPSNNDVDAPTLGNKRKERDDYSIADAVVNRLYGTPRQTHHTFHHLTIQVIQLRPISTIPIVHIRQSYTASYIHMVRRRSHIVFPSMLGTSS